MPEPTDPGPVPIPESDDELLRECRVDVFRSGGAGGQHQNVTESGVRLVHRPSGVTVQARDHRSQHRNRALALARLRKALEERNRVEKPRVPTRPTRASKERTREQKRMRSEKKRGRRPPKLDDA